MWSTLKTWIQSGNGILATVAAGAAAVAGVWKFWRGIWKAFSRAGEILHFHANIDKILTTRLDAIDRGQSHMIQWRQFLLDRETGNAFFGCNPNGEYNWVSDHWMKLTGISDSMALGNGWELGVAKEDRERVVQAWRESVERRRFFEENFSFVNRDGVLTPMKVFAKPIVDDAGTILGWAGRASK